MGSLRLTLSVIGRFLGAFIAFAGRQSLTAGALVTAGAFVDGAGIVLIIPLLGLVMGEAGQGGRLETTMTALFAAAGITSVLGRMAVLLALFALLMTVRAVVVVWRDVLLMKLQTGFVEQQRAELMTRLGAARWDQVVALSHARVTHLLGTDIQRISFACYMTVQCTVAVALLLIHAVLAVALSPALAALAFVLQLIGFAAILPSVRKARALGQYLTESNRALNDAATQFLGGLKLAKSQNLEGRFVEQFRTTLAEATGHQVDHMRVQSGSRMAVNTMMALAGAVLVMTGYAFLHLPAPVLLTLLFIIARMGAPAQQLQTGAQQLAIALPSFEALEALKAELANETATSASAGEALPEGPVTFEHVTYLHRTGDSGVARGVQDLSLHIAPGEFVGISGPSGAGKTTFCDLLTGLFPPQAGRICIGGTPLDQAHLPAWRAGLAYVSQDPFLFHKSIRWNLTFATPGATEEELWQALAVAGAADLVRAMPLGLETLTGERGMLVSGGERQRLALAGALLRKPRLLVLDEATSAIDIASEKAILTALLSRIPRPTLIMVAHRPESLSLCDRILTIGPAAGRHSSKA